jgi:fructan beta-fructosidase
VYDAAKGTLTCKDVVAPIEGRRGELQLRVLVDRGSVEVFADSGRVAMSVAAIPDEKNRDVVLTPAGGSISLRGGGLWRMKSAWGK